MNYRSTHLLHNLGLRKKNLPKLCSGFTLIETIIAVLIIGTSITVLFGLQSLLIKGVFFSHNIVERMIYIKNIFVKAEKDELYKKKEPTIKKISDPEMTLTYQAQELKDKKEFERFRYIVQEQVKAVWGNIFTKHQEIFVSFKFVPDVQEEE